MYQKRGARALRVLRSGADGFAWNQFELELLRGKILPYNTARTCKLHQLSSTLGRSAAGDGPVSRLWGGGDASLTWGSDVFVFAFDGETFMPCVLLVDDSSVDRRLIGGLMTKELDWLVEYAASGTEALQEMELALPDLVVTDLMMPEMDGLQLVAEVRRRYPKVPVILITAHGNETLAVEALEKGAASYVPKSQMATKLLDTARQVLSLTSAERTQVRLLECLTQTQSTFVLDNHPEIIPSFVDDVLDKVNAMRLCDPSETRHLAVSLEEALLNAMLHGNLQFDPGEVQQVRSDLMRGQKSPLVRQRQEELRDRKIEARYELCRRQACFVVRDEGKGFDLSTIPISGDPNPIDAERGRGLVLIQNFMDEVKFNDVGNEITMVKHWTRVP